MKQIKVLISDFQFLPREGLIKLTESTQNFDLVGVLEDQTRCMDQFTQLQPDVLILGYTGGQLDMNETLTEVITLQASKVLIVTDKVEKAHIQKLSLIHI